MPRFKKGDRVVLDCDRKRNGDLVLPAGATGTVIQTNSAMPHVEWDENYSKQLYKLSWDEQEYDNVWAVYESSLSMQRPQNPVVFPNGSISRIEVIDNKTTIFFK